MDRLGVERADERLQVLHDVPLVRPRADALDPLVDVQFDAMLAELFAPRFVLGGLCVYDQPVKVEDERLEDAYAFNSLAFSMSRWIGSLNQNVEPLPMSDSAQISPKCT